MSSYDSPVGLTAQHVTTVQVSIASMRGFRKGVSVFPKPLPTHKTDA